MVKLKPMKNVNKTNLEPVEGYMIMLEVSNKTDYSKLILNDEQKRKYSDYQIVKVGSEKSPFFKHIGRSVIFNLEMLNQVTSVKDSEEKTFWLAPEKAVACLK